MGAWRLGSLIGQGRLSHVYSAQPVDGGVSDAFPYAVKVLRWPWDTDPRGQAMLRREVFVGRRVADPHVVPVLTAALDEGPYYAVMPRLTGQTAADLLSTNGPLDVPIGLWIARQMAQGLAAMHAAGWVHGDVKPANVMVDPSGHATLIDLGFAQPIGNFADAANADLLGTPEYLAPEQLVARCRADQRSDLYSLGVSLFELLTGRRPTTAAAQKSEHLTFADSNDVRKLAPHLPLQVARLLRELLSREPLRRPQSALEVADRLASLEIATFAERQLT
jgi:serine/threonine-protein kinase